MPGGFDTVLVVDFGAQYAQLIARRVRECHVYSEIVPATMPAEQMLARQPEGHHLVRRPVLGVRRRAPRPRRPACSPPASPCSASATASSCMVAGLGGTVERTGAAEYGATALETGPSRLLAGTPRKQQVWMSHGDTCHGGPAGLPGDRADRRDAGGGDREPRPPPVRRPVPSRGGAHRVRHPVLARFLELAGCRPSWTMLNIVEDQVAAIREQIGGGRAICGLSGGVDSAVAAALVQRAIGDRLTCVFVDHGLLRKGEAEQVEQDFVAATGVRLKVATEADGVRVRAGRGDRPGAASGRSSAGSSSARSSAPPGRSPPRPARPASVRVPGPGHAVPGRGRIGRRHRHGEHQVPPQRRRAARRPEVPPGRAAALRCSRTRCAGWGPNSACPRPSSAASRSPAPAWPSGSSARSPPSGCAVLREADAIVREEMSAAGLDALVWQCPVVLLADVRSVGVQGDGRSYGHPLVLRPVTSEDAMTADWARLPADVLARISTRVTNEVPEVNRVVLDVTSKPPATIEWE